MTMPDLYPTDTSNMTIADIAKMFADPNVHVHYDGDAHAFVRDGQ